MKKFSVRYPCAGFALAIISTLFLITSIYGQQQVLSSPEILKPVKMGISQPVRDLPLISQKEIENWPDGIIPLRTPFDKSEVEVKEVERDGSLQEYKGPLGTSTITQNFDGVGAQGYAPPDPSGDVGPNHYVQMVNVRSQIWDKNGNTLAGPFSNIDFWSGLPGPWSGTNDGDPIVLYDDMADRWMVSQFALPNYPNGPFYQLIAVSTTPDPTGTYYQYAFSFPDMPDYPKFGVWPDGYYMSANVFASGSGNYIGTYAAVFDRNTMLVGGSASAAYWAFSSSTWSFLPSDADGVAPPAGAPNYFLETYAPYLAGNSDLDIYEFHMDWVTPANATFTGPLLLPTPTFTWVNGIPQLGTGTLLDDLSDRPMNRLQYRNFGTHESMVVSQTVNAGSGRAGMRWWELRKSGGAWSIYQEGTYAPADGLFRWMGSIAMDSSGDIALGYSVSSSGMYPDIRYTGRLSSDPLGVMTVAETIIYPSGGPQTGLSRWGDYTQMTVDPAEPNTFWYTNQYQPSSGSFNWNTRIAAFQLGGGGGGQFLVWEGVLGGQDYSGAYINTFLTNAGYTVDYTSTFPASLIGYDAIFLSFGNFTTGNTIFNATMAATVQTYLEAGGRVYLEGGDALEYDQATNVALHDLFGLGDGFDGNTNSIDGLTGQTGAITEGMLFTSSSQANFDYIDIYVPTTGTLAFAESGYGDVGVQYAGTYGQKTFGFSYALAYLTDGSFPSTKDELMTRILDFLTSPPASPPDIDISPTSFTFNVPVGGTDSDVLTISNLGDLDLIWNMFEQEFPLDAVRLELADGRKLPVKLQLNNEWIQPTKDRRDIPLNNKISQGFNINEKNINKLNNTSLAAISIVENSFIPGITANVGLECSGGEIHDDGTVENGYGWNSATVSDGRILDLFNPGSYPYNYTQVCINWTQNGGDANINFNIVVYDDDGPGGEPGTLLASIPVTANGVPFWPSVAFFDFNVTGLIPPINSGNVYIGAQWDPMVEQDFFISADESPTTPLWIGYAYNDVDGVWTPNQNYWPGYRAMFIRAEGSGIDIPWLAENPTNGTIPAGGNQNVDIMVDATGLTVGTYNGNLLINSNDPDEPTVTVPVTLNVTGGNPPDISVSPTSFTFNVPENGTDTDILTISNVAPAGSQDLNWDIFEQEAILALDNGESINVSITKNNITKDWLDDFNINEWRAKYKNASQLSDVSSNLFVSNPDNTDALGDILDSFTAPGTPDPIGVTYDPYLDAVWVTDQAGGQLFLVDKSPPYPILQTLTLPPLTTAMGPDDIAVVGNALYISDYNGDLSTHDDLIYAIDKTTGVLIDFWELDGAGNPNPSDAIDQIIGLTVNGSGEFFASNNVDNIIRKIDLQPGGNWQTLQTYSSPTGGPTAGLFWDPQQNGFWVANVIGAPMFLTDYGFTPLNSFPAPSSFSTGITSIFDGNLWVSDPGTNLIYVIEGLPVTDIPWLSENPISGTIPAGGSQNVDIMVDATGLPVGTYNGNVLINSNDPDEPTVTVPVTLNVGGADFSADLLVYDNGTGQITLVFGTDPSATEGYDPWIDVLAPPPPPGGFDARFKIPGFDLLEDFRATNLDDIRIWHVHYFTDPPDEPISFSWDPGQLPPDGNFTLIDFATGGTLVNVNMRTDNSYTDNIGLGHLQIIFNYEVSVNFDFAVGWNMLGLPLIVPDPYYLTLFPNAVPNTLFGYSGGYFSTDIVLTSTGYWLNHPQEIVEVTGLNITESVIDLAAGWNMIGGPNCSVPIGNIEDPGGIIIPGTIFGYDGGYYSATSIDATKGYWIMASAPGTITISCGTLLAKGGNDLTIPVETLTDFGKIDISDAGSKGQILYFNGKLDENTSIESFSMPPVSPKGSFDARLTGGYRLNESDEVTIQVQSSNYPLSVTVTDLNYEEGYGYVLQEIVSGVEVGSHTIVDGVKIVISNENVSLLKITKQQAIPTSFKLAQNYPNPFNPSTMIKYDLPETRNVTLVIYNALGEQVRTLVSGMQDAGYYSILWDAKNDSGSKVGSGMYIYALRAGNYYSVKKMMLLK